MTDKAHEELKALQDGVASLKRELSALNKEKESWFQKRAEIGSEIAERIKTVKQKRTQRDELTKEVQEGKKERRTYSKEIKDKITEVKELRETRKHAQDKLDVKNARELKKQVEKLEFKLETQPMSYKDEQKLTKTIKDLKQKLVKFKEVEGLSRKIKSLSKKIDSLKKGSDVVHEQMQHHAEHSQEFHEEVLHTSHEIDALKKQEAEAFDKFTHLKDEYAKKRALLQEQVERLEKLKQELGVKDSEASKHKQHEMLREKGKEVEKKVKEGKKLTTEDLLAFQANE